jgi:hypothetical protein
LAEAISRQWGVRRGADCEDSSLATNQKVGFESLRARHKIRELCCLWWLNSGGGDQTVTMPAGSYVAPQFWRNPLSHHRVTTLGSRHNEVLNPGKILVLQQLIGVWQPSATVESLGGLRARIRTTSGWSASHYISNLGDSRGVLSAQSREAVLLPTSMFSAAVLQPRTYGISIPSIFEGGQRWVGSFAHCNRPRRGV